PTLADIPALFDDHPRFRALQFLDQGGMGCVYQARQLNPARDVAVKVLTLGPAATPDLIERFRREALTGGLDHPHLLPVYEASTHRGLPYLVMKLARGGTLKQQLQQLWQGRGGRDSLPRADLERFVRLMVPVARAVHHLHERGHLHRDLKPANILLDEDG